MKPTLFYRGKVAGLLAACALSTSALAADFVPQGPHSGANPAGTKVVDVIAKLPMSSSARGKVVALVGKVFEHPAVKRLKLSEEQRECQQATLASIVLQALVNSAHSAMGRSEMRGADEALRQLWDAGDDWCDRQGGNSASKAFAVVMREHGVKVEVPATDGIADAKVRVPSRPVVIQAMEAMLALGVVVSESTGAALSSATLLPGFVIIPPKPSRHPLSGDGI